jgi:hypothetical protein
MLKNSQCPFDLASYDPFLRASFRQLRSAKIEKIIHSLIEKLFVA